MIYGPRRYSFDVGGVHFAAPADAGNKPMNQSACFLYGLSIERKQRALRVRL